MTVPINFTAARSIKTAGRPVLLTHLASQQPLRAFPCSCYLRLVTEFNAGGLPNGV